jgi:hypothetical protein
VKIEFAQNDRAGFFQAGNNLCILSRNAIFEQTARSGRPNAGRINVVLECDGNTV